MATPDRHLLQAVERAWPKLAGLLGRIGVLLGAVETALPARITRGARLQALRLLRPGEALLRRLIILMAYQRVAEGGLALCDTASGKPCEAGDCGGKPRPRRRGFRLFEATPSMASVFAPPRAVRPTGPGPRCLDLAGDYPAADCSSSGPAADGVGASGVAERFAALAQACARPDRHVARLARRLMRRSGRLRRSDAMRPGRAPGARSRFTPAWLAEALTHLTGEIRALPPPGTDRSFTARLP